MSQTVDVNVLLYASNEDAPEHVRAGSLLRHLASGPGLVVLLWPVVMGYVRIATHPSVFPNPLSHGEAVRNVEALLSRPHVRPAGEAEGFWNAYCRTSDEVRARGNLVPDAHLVALMRQHGIATIWSRDRDLRKFDGIDARDPFSDRYRDGFGRRRRPGDDRS